jgi:hypothetical protein
MLHHREAFKLVGIETRTSNSLEMDPETAKFPDFGAGSSRIMFLHNCLAAILQE